MKIRKINIFLMFLALIFISCNTGNSKHLNNRINHEGIYVSSDTLYTLDKNYKNLITLRLLKLNRDGTVQVSKSYMYSEGENKLNNDNLTDWLFDETSYRYTMKGKTKVVIGCFAKRAKTCWYCWGGPSRVSKISEKFKIIGDTLIRIKKSNENFSKKYILDKGLYNNHQKIRIGNACS